MAMLIPAALPPGNIHLRKVIRGTEMHTIEIGKTESGTEVVIRHNGHMGIEHSFEMSTYRSTYLVTSDGLVIGLTHNSDCLWTITTVQSGSTQIRYLPGPGPVRVEGPVLLFELSVVGPLFWITTTETKPVWREPDGRQVCSIPQ